jgi:cytoskeleton protein RodZ
MGALGGPEAVSPQGLAAATPVVTPTPDQGASLGPEDALSAQTPPAPAAAAEVGTQSLAAAGPGVVLEFRGPCWVDIRDAAKTFSLKGEMAKGDRRVLGGTPPYELKLGNAAAVSITVNGVPFDISRVARTNSPRFKLDPTIPQ